MLHLGVCLFGPISRGFVFLLLIDSLFTVQVLGMLKLALLCLSLFTAVYAASLSERYFDTYLDRDHNGESAHRWLLLNKLSFFVT